MGWHTFSFLLTNHVLCVLVSSITSTTIIAAVVYILTQGFKHPLRWPAPHHYCGKHDLPCAGVGLAQVVWTSYFGPFIIGTLAQKHAEDIDYGRKPAEQSWHQSSEGTSQNKENLFNQLHCVTQLKLDTGEKLSSTIFCCLSVSEALVTPDQISTFPNIFRPTNPLLTLYHLIPSSINLYWPSTSQYCHIDWPSTIKYHL